MIKILCILKIEVVNCCLMVLGSCLKRLGAKAGSRESVVGLVF